MTLLITTVEGYLQRAAEAAKFAAETNLPNVRVRHLASEQSWRELAARKDAAQVASDRRSAIKTVRAI